MKQLLFNLIFVLIVVQLAAQESIWEEDFSEGLHGWTVNTTSCSGITHPNFGVWELVGGTIDGQNIDFGTGYFRWSFINSLEYSISFSNDLDADLATSYGTIYARYEMNSGVLESDISTAVFNTYFSGDTSVVESTNGIVRWATNMELDEQNTTQIGRMIGADNPLITFSNGSQSFTYDSQDDQVSLLFSRISSCGNLWNWSPNGNVGYGILNFNEGLTIISDTRENGVAVINTLFHNAQGDLSYIPGQDPVYSFVSELISPPIDISLADKPLALKFTEFVLYENLAPDAPSTHTSFAISNDNGQTWSVDYDVNENLLPRTSSDERPTLPIKINDVGDANEIRIKFTWGSDLYFWAIDDIAVVEREDFDMKINTDYYVIPTNVWTPASQVEPQFFLADIQNNGALTAENVILNLNIGNINNNAPAVYDENNFFNSIVADALAENSIFDEPLFADDQEVGIYKGTYVLSHNSPDSNPNNDTINFVFAVTDTLFSKESGRTRRVAPAVSSWYIGNSFYVPNGDGYFARYLTFMVENASIVINGAGRVITHLYETDGDVNNNFRIEGNELTEIAQNEYFFTGDENRELITIPISQDGQGVPLKNEKHYLAVVQYLSQNNNDRLLMSGSEAYDYNANFFMNRTLMMHRYSDVVALSSNNPSFSIGGFQGKVVPVIRLSIGNNPNLSEDAVANINLLSDSYQLNVFPNPTKGYFQLKIDLLSALDVNLRLVDENNKLIFSENYLQLTQGLFNYDVSDLNTGVYFLKLSTPIGIKTEKIVVVK